MNHLPKCPVCNRAASMTVHKTFCNHWAGAHIGDYCKGSRQSVPQEYLDYLQELEEKEQKEKAERLQRNIKQEQWLKEKRLERSKIYRSKEWKEKREEILSDTCAYCGSKDKLCLHHLDETSYKNIDVYKNISDENVITLCNLCHYHIHRGRDVCQVCKKNYKGLSFQMCRECFLDSRHLTKRAPDAGESAVSTNSLQASAESTSQTVTTPTQRG